jgi:hypothetical protein
MQIVSIISDFGHKDYYLAELTASLYTKCDDIRIIDISHNLELFDISLASYYLKCMLPSLPQKSINIVSVNNYYSKKPRYLIFEREDKYFMGPNNGVFTLLFDDLENVYEINIDDLDDKQIHNIYSHACACLSHKLPLEEFSKPLETPLNTKLNFRPVVTKDQIKTTIIHIDQYENVITNCTKEIFEKSRAGRNFSIYYNPNDPIEYLSKHYGEVAVGEVLAWFNTSDHLELAINMGTASTSLHLFKNETIQIDFH